MGFTSEGRKKVVVKDAIIAEPKFSPNDNTAFDIALYLEDPTTGEGDWWHGEISQRYGKGNAADKTQAQLTTMTLTQLGLPNNDLTKYQEVIGAETEAMVEASSCGKYYNIKYVGSGGNAPKKMDPAEAQRRFAALFGRPRP